MPKFRAGDWVRFVNQNRLPPNVVYEVVEVTYSGSLVLRQRRPFVVDYGGWGSFFPAPPHELKMYMTREEVALEAIENSPWQS